MPFSNKGAARDAILNHFKSGWDAQSSPVPAVVYDDVSHDSPPSNGTLPWIRVNVFHNDGRQSTLGGVGNRRFTKFGLVTVQVFTPFGGGLVQSDYYVDIIEDIFEGKHTSGGDSVWFRNVKSQEIGQSGSWHQTNVLAEFEYDGIK